MPATTKFDVPSLNLKSHDLFEIAKVFAVRNPTQRKDCVENIAELNKLTVEAKHALDSENLSFVHMKEVSRAIDKLNIARNFFQKSLDSFTSVEDARRNAEEALAKKRKEKEALIASRAKERAIRDENRKKKEQEEARVKAKERAELGV